MSRQQANNPNNHLPPAVSHSACGKRSPVMPLHLPAKRKQTADGQCEMRTPAWMLWAGTPPWGHSTEPLGEQSWWHFTACINPVLADPAAQREEGIPSGTLRCMLAAGQFVGFCSRCCLPFCITYHLIISPLLLFIVSPVHKGLGLSSGLSATGCPVLAEQCWDQRYSHQEFGWGTLRSNSLS